MSSVGQEIDRTARFGFVPAGGFYIGTVCWMFALITQKPDPVAAFDFQTARKYWNKLKERLGKEGIAPVFKQSNQAA